MAARNAGRPWTPQEDHQLTQAVRAYGENSDWKTIALHVPHRTNKACRKRWLHSLSPTIKKSAWTHEEDESLLRLYATHGTRWSAIARNIPGRTDDACSKRYREALDPQLKKDEWTPEEDEKLLEVHSRIGGQWGKIGEEMQRRSGLACRNRWRLLERKRTSVVQPEERFVPHVPPSEPAHQTESPGSSDNTPLWPTHPLMHPLSQLWAASMPDFNMNSSFLLPEEPNQHPDLISASNIAYAPPPGPPPHSSRNFHSYPPPPPLPLRSEDTIIFAQEQSHTTHTTLQSTPSSLSAALDSPDSPPRASQPSYNPISHMPPRSTEYAPMPHEGYDFSTYTMPNHSPQHSPESCSAELFSGDTSPVFSDSTPLPPHASILYHHQHENAFSPYPDVSPSPAFASDSSVSTPIIATPPTRLNIPLPLPQVSSFPSQSNAFGAPAVVRSPISRPRGPFITTSQSEMHSIPIAQSPRTPKTPTSTCLSRLEHPTSQPAKKLSSNLAASTDPNIFAYACGHPDCWPDSMDKSMFRVCTAKELGDHCKEVHRSDMNYERKPYRCGLCENRWKNLNGLMYHLQVSKAHFQDAITHLTPSSAVDIDSPTADDNAVVTVRPPSAPAPGREKDSGKTLKAKKKYQCPKCSKVYKQLSGLRYHESHGHPQNIPMQLDDVPPTLARKMAEKFQRLGEVS